MAGGSSSSGARKRKGYSADAQALAIYRPFRNPYKKRRMFVPGKDRVGGYYGRYAGRHGELKFFDSTLTDAVVATGGNFTNSINKIPQGVTESERVGRKCTLKSLWWRYQVTLPRQDAVVVSSNGDSIRIVLYLDKQANGATATAADLLETDTFHGFRNLSNQNRFVWLYDKIHNVNYSGMASDGAGVVSQEPKTFNFMCYKKLDLPVEFSGTTGAIGEIKSNNLGVMLMSANGICGFDSNIRLRFSDGS